MNAHQEYKQFVQKYLAQIEKKCIAKIKKISTQQVVGECDEINFQVKYKELFQDFPITYCYYFQNAQMTYEKNGMTFLRPAYPLLQDKLPKRQLNKFFEAGVETLELHVPLIRKWFVACWKKAKIKNCLYTVTVLLEDDRLPAILFKRRDLDK